MSNKLSSYRTGVMAAMLTAAFAVAATPASSTPLKALFGHSPTSAKSDAATDHVITVQSDQDVYRIGQLEEQVRALNGRIEELGFQLLQMEEKMRQMQEDNEYRFQQLEGGGNGAGPDQRTEATPPVTEAPMDHAGANALPGVEDSTTSSTAQGQQLGTPPRSLGTITFDQNGNAITSGVSEGDVTDGGALSAPANGGGNGLPGVDQSASLGGDPSQLYRAGYEHMLSGDYAQAEQIFRDYIGNYPNDTNTADAMFWMGEAQYSQGNYNNAAQTFLDAHKRFPQAEKGADTMLKLGMSLAALDKREAACATYRQLGSNYPGASQAIKNKLQQEQVNASC